MNIVQLVAIFTLVLVVSVQSFSHSRQPLDYSPCKHYDGNSIDCADHTAFHVLNAFRRNRDNGDLEMIYLREIADMTDDILAEILDIVSASASHSVREIGLSILPQVAKVPGSLKNFTNLQTLYLEGMDRFKTLPFASLTLPPSLTEIVCVFNHNLESIESGAFQGNFDGTAINLSFNNLRKFDEATFKPLLSDSTLTMQIYHNPIPCDCNLTWILRDNREYLQRVTGSCKDLKGNSIKLVDVDVNTLENC